MVGGAKIVSRHRVIWKSGNLSNLSDFRIIPSVEQLRHGSKIIEALIAGDGLLVTGAWYSLETGRVEFLDGMLAG